MTKFLTHRKGQPMSNLHILGSLASSGGGGGGPVADTFDVTVPSGTVGSDLTDFPVMVDLNDMPAAFWLAVRADGGNVRAYADDGTTLIPHDLTYINTATGRGRMFVKHTLSAASDTTFKVKVLDAAETVLAVGDANGRNAVWSDYEVVWQFPSEDNRTGNAYEQDMNPVPFSLWKQVQYHEFAGNPHQGITAEASGRVITIDTNYLRRYDSSNLSSTLATNSDPCGDIQTATGGATTHMCDGTVISGELFAVCNNFPALSPSQEHLAVFDADTLALKRTYDISGLAGEQLSSCCLNPSNGMLYCTNYETGSKIHVFSQTGVFQSSITLSSTLDGAQGIEYVDGKLYVSQEATGNPVWEVELDGTVNGVVYNRPTAGINEGIAYDGTDLWVLDGDGDLVRLAKKPEQEDWIKVHYDLCRTTFTTTHTWTMATSIYWTVPSGDLQQGFLGVNDTTPSTSTHEALMYDEGPDVFGSWNLGDGWVHTGINPAAYSTHRIAQSRAGAGARRIYIDGAQEATDTATSLRPIGTEGVDEMDFVMNDVRRTSLTDGEAYYQHVWFRAEEMSADWMDADNENMSNPSGFYSITAA